MDQPVNRAMISRATIAPIRRAIEDKVSTPPEHVQIDVWLDSPGGDANAAYKLALMLRAAAKHVRVVIPDFAKSAATLLAVAGDELYVGPGADMGPLDAQMMPEEGSMSAISALDIARAADEVARDALQMAIIGGAELRETTGLSRAQTIEAMLSFSARFSEPLVSQLDPKLVHQAKQTLRVTAEYAENLLRKTGCPNAGQIAKALVEDFPTHGYAISIDTASKLGLPVKSLEEYEFANQVLGAVRQEEAGKRLIDFLPLEEVIGQPQGHKDEGAAETNEASSRDGGDNGRGDEMPSAATDIVPPQE